MEYLLHQLTKNKSSFVLLLLLCFYSSTYAQTQECGTEELSEEEMRQLPWYGNPDYLYNFLDSMNRAYNIRTSRIEPGIRFKVPIRFWILQGRNIDPALSRLSK